MVNSMVEVSTGNYGNSEKVLAHQGSFEVVTQNVRCKLEDDIKRMRAHARVRARTHSHMHTRTHTHVHPHLGPLCLLGKSTMIYVLCALVGDQEGQSACWPAS